MPDASWAGAQPSAKAASARWPASPRMAHSSAAATVRSSSRSGGVGKSYHSPSAAPVQASVLSTWQRLHALGRPVSALSATDGLLIVWLRIAFSRPYDVYGMWQL